jgi:hypothetical protein
MGFSKTVVPVERAEEVEEVWMTTMVRRTTALK